MKVVINSPIIKSVINDKPINASFKGGRGPKGDSAIIASPLKEYDTHAEAIADATLTIGSFYVLSVTNLEGFPSEGQYGPIFIKN